MRQKFGSAKTRFRACLQIVALLGSISVAAPSAAEDAAVEALIQRGIQLRRNSKDEDALAVFLEAERQDPASVRVLLHVVTAAQAAGKWLMADSYMRKVSALSDDSYYQRHEDAIDVVRRSIAQRVGSFQAQGSPDGASVRLDGRLVGTLPMNEPASVEAGSYVMEVQKPGFYRLRRNVNISGGVLTREPIELVVAAPRADGAGASLLASGSGEGAGVGADSGDRSWLESPAVGWSLIGLGVASGIVSGVSFVTRENRAERWNDEDSCLPNTGASREAECGSLKEDAELAQTVGVVSGVAGVVFLGAGIAHLLATQSSEPSAGNGAASGLTVEGCGAGLLSVGCYGSF